MLADIFALQPKGLIYVAWKNPEFHDKAFKTLEEAEEFLSSIEGDKYFCPTTFSQTPRRKNNVLASQWLWQDLDPVDPRKIYPRPTIAWETSPGRYQALWKLDKQYPPQEIEKLNKRLAELTNADHGSWILTKVLRIPGTSNWKYTARPSVKLLWREDKSYTPDEIVQQLPSKVKDLLETDSTGQDRSDTLWFMEHELANAGFNIDQIYNLIKHSQWNKYKGRADEEQRLAHEISLALKNKVTASDTRPQARGLKITGDRELMANPNSSPGWLIENFWTKNSHGIIAGEPKSYKSTLAMDMAISVASGKPFLGQYPVLDTGSVVIVQNENADWIMRSRMAAIRQQRGLGGTITGEGRHRQIKWPRELPIYYINNQGFSFSNAEQCRQLEELIQKVKPVLVIFDPLYLMFDGDLNSAKDLNPALSWLLWLKTTYNFSLILIHHWRKSQGSTKRGGQRMLGSTTLHGWVESAWYVQSGETVELEKEFRAAQGGKVDLRISLGDMEHSEYEVEVIDKEEKDIQEIKNYVSLHPEAKPKEIAEATGFDSRKVKRALEGPKKFKPRDEREEGFFDPN